MSDESLALLRSIDKKLDALLRGPARVIVRRYKPAPDEEPLLRLLLPRIESALGGTLEKIG